MPNRETPSSGLFRFHSQTTPKGSESTRFCLVSSGESLQRDPMSFSGNHHGQSPIDPPLVWGGFQVNPGGSLVNKLKPQVGYTRARLWGPLERPIWVWPGLDLQVLSFQLNRAPKKKFVLQPFETCCFFNLETKGHRHLQVAMFRCIMHPDPCYMHSG